jgi:Spy/CpxP family protein refolding chaperone
LPGLRPGDYGDNRSSFMTTRFKTSLAAALAVVTIATAAPMLMAAASAKATAPTQDQPQRRQGPGFHLRQGYGGQVGLPPLSGPGGPGMRRGGPMGFGPGFRELDLTDDQKAQLKTIADSHRAEFEAVGKKIGAVREGMRALAEGDSINEGAIRAKSAEIAAAEADLIILNAKVRQESMQVLTSEQLQKMTELRTAREGQMRQRKPRGQH